MMSHHSAVAELLHRPQWAPTRCHTRRRRHAAACAGNGAATVPPSWPGCVQQLASCGFSSDEADTMLRKAHGWGFQKYWRTTKDHEEPVEAELSSRLTYLRQLCDGDEDLLRAVLSAFPEAVALDVDTVLAPNVALLERTYRIAPGPALAGVLKRKPQVLGNNLDCYGDCAGECNRCWARF